MIVDANLFPYAVDSTSPHHHMAREWWEVALNGRSRVRLPDFARFDDLRWVDPVRGRG